MVVQLHRVAQPVGRGVGHSSVGRCLLVLRALHREEVLQFPLQGFEGRAAQGIAVPTLQHYVVQSGRATGRRRHPVTVLHLVQNFRVCHACEIDFCNLNANKKINFVSRAVGS